jgi:hypothetical protein
MPSSDKRDGLVSSKVTQLCSMSFCRSYGNTPIVLKIRLIKVFLAGRVLLGSCVVSTLCLKVMLISRLINDYVYV